jgi:hypothetical protein
MKIFAFVLFAAAACSPFDPDLGTAPYKCGDVEPRCPDGYQCDSANPDPTQHVCVAPGGLLPDSGTSGFQCLDDSPFGNNDSHTAPTPTTIPGQTMYSARAAICPEADKDHFGFMITTPNSNVEVKVDWESGMAVNAAILNAAGTSIGNASPIDDKHIRVCVPNLPNGNYSASIFAISTVKNNYRVEINIVPNC